MKSTNRGTFKEKQSHHDNYSTSISSANKVIASNNRHHIHRQLTSAKGNHQSSGKFHLKSHQGSPFRNNVSTSSVNVSEKFVNFVQDLGIPVNVRSQQAFKSSAAQSNNFFCSGFANQENG